MSDSGYPSLLLQQKRVEAILKNKNTTAFWEEKKKANEEVQKSLEHYARKLQEFIMVPIGKRGLMRGRIVNTNQVFVSLGGGWFTKVCSAEAQKVCSRRISECNEMLDKLEKERRLLEGWTALSGKQVFATEDSKEIVEPYNEQEEESWRKQHAEKVKEHKKKLAEVRQKLENNRGKEKNTEDELWKHLELLELQEEFEDELNRLGENSESDPETVSPLDSDDDSCSEEEAEQNESKMNTVIAAKKTETNREKSSAKVHNNEGPSDHNITITAHQTNNSAIKTKKTNTVKKKVTFATPENDYQNDHILESKNASIRQRETIALGEVTEHSVDTLKYQQMSQECRPVSKFKSSKLSSKK